MSQSDSRAHFLLKSCSYLSVFTTAFILLIKIYAWLKTDSVAILASLIDSGLDITSSFINMLALRFSLMPPDDNHRFGHEKIQDLAVFGQGFFFIGSSIAVLISSIMHLYQGVAIENSQIGINVMIISAISTFALVAYQTYVLSNSNSNIIKADKLHYVTDLFTNITIIISIYLSGKYWFLDSIFAGLISIYLAYGAYKLLVSAARNLLDEEFSPDDKVKILAIFSKHKKEGNILAIHDLKTRQAGDKHFIQFHAEMDGKMSLDNTHRIIEIIEKEIMATFPQSEVIIHQDPAGIKEKVSFYEEFSISK